MKVLHLSSEKTWRGGEQQIAYLVQEQLKAGLEVIVAAKKDSSFLAYATKNNFKSYACNFTNSFDLSTASRISSIVKNENPDIVHIHSSKSHGIAALATLFSMKKPIVVSRRVDFPLKKNAFSQWKYNHKQVVSIACVSKAIEQIVRKDVKRPERCTTIYSGVDLEKFDSHKGSNYLREKYNVPNDTLIIGNTSAIAPHKDYFTFIDSVAVFLKSSDVKTKFFIIGKGPLEDEIKAYIQNKKLSDHIVMTGFMDNIKEVLPSLDIFMMTSETEGLGTSILDAFVAEIPVLATEAGGIPEIVHHQQTGLLAPVKVPETIAGLLKELVENIELREKLKKNAGKFVAQFSYKEMANAYISLYKDLLKNLVH